LDGLVINFALLDAIIGEAEKESTETAGPAKGARAATPFRLLLSVSCLSDRDKLEDEEAN
jgi:hypothetical protein